MGAGQQLTIAAEFAGFPGIAHGGYVCGLLADALAAHSVRTRFIKPVAIGAPLALDADEKLAELSRGEEALARCEPAPPLQLALPEPVSAERAARASEGTSERRRTCFRAATAAGRKAGRVA